MIPGLAYVTGQLELLSAPGQRALADSCWLEDYRSIAAAGEELRLFLEALSDESKTRVREEISTLLMSMRDINGTLTRLAEEETLDDVEFFEVKWLALHAARLRERMGEFIEEWRDRIPDLSEVAALLDPAGNGNTAFHIYDTYSPRLKELREQLRELSEGDSESSENTETYDSLMVSCLEEEARVRKDLSKRLCSSAQKLKTVLREAGTIDLLRAKALLVRDHGFSLPVFAAKSGSKITGMFQPEVKQACESRGSRYQPVDLTLHEGVTILTGANMTGKSVVLQTLALIQSLAQFGFPVPAAGARLKLYNDVLISAGDQMSGTGGLSSYAGEMKKIDEILALAERHHIMALIDEPARTTNPEEGEAIVGAIADLLSDTGSCALITTHYSVAAPGCRRLRVKGLEDCPVNLTDPREIAKRIDYSLVTHTGPEPPREALRIAAMIGISPRLIDTAREKLSKRTSTSIRYDYEK